MKDKDQVLLENFYFQILKENNNNWKDAPDDVGFWWFYGDIDYGVVANREVKKKLYVVELQRTGGDKFVASESGRILYVKPHNPDKPRQGGYIGLWQKCIIPDLPTI